MTVPVPNLDNRRWDDLVAEARTYLRGRTPAWNDFSANDPGFVLVELFAHLTELMIYQLNKAPEKAYREYLRLIGLTMRPPAAAAVTLRFDAGQPVTTPIVIPRGTRASVGRASGAGEAPVFSTADPATIVVGVQSVDVLAHHCEFIDGELIGRGTGQPMQSFTVQHPPVIAPTGNELDLVIGVEATPEELGARVPAREHDGKTFRLWQEVGSFINRAPDETVYVADRLAGRITFAPALSRPAPEGGSDGRPVPMAAFPGLDRMICAWYRSGGGPDGNVATGSITVMKDPIAGIKSVANPEAATGGRPAETLDEALIRGTQELHGVERAVTAGDYEAIALNAGGAVARARAFTKAAVWRHAAPGTVAVLLVPYVDPAELGGGRLTPEVLHSHETETARAQVADAIGRCLPLSITCEVGFPQYKTVKVIARVVVRREENQEAVRRRIEQRLYQTISPLPAPGSAGWRFGQALRVSHVFDDILKEPGVRFVDNVRLLVERAPSQNVLALAADAFQPNAWYAGAGDTIFRSLNDAESWEAVATFAGETARRIESHPERPGLVAVVTSVGTGSRLHVSVDTGETWDASPLRAPEFPVNDLAWSMKGDAPTLLLAADTGLFELGLDAGATLVPIQVTPQLTKGFYAVAGGVDALGARNVAVAAQGAGGVWLSSAGGAPQTFRTARLGGEDIRTLAIERDGPRAFLWAGAAAAGSDDPGKGAWRWELRGDDDPPEGWVAYAKGWSAGSCWGLAFHDGTVYAATHHGGVLRADARHSEAAWQPLDPNAGLKLRDPKQFLFDQVDAVAAGPGLILAGMKNGVFASHDGARYEPASQTEFSTSVALPSTWLFASGEHEIEIVSEADIG